MRPFPSAAVLRLALLPLLPLAPSLASASSVADAADGQAPVAADPVEQAWTEATRYLFADAYRAFGEADSREARLGRAALLLLQQPKTQGNLDNAVRALEQLAAGEAADDISATALYLLGRVAQIHRPDPDPVAAAAHYRRLLESQPAHLLADQALIKLALIELLDPAVSGDALLARFDDYERRADALARPGSRRDLHLVLANLARHHRLGDERLLRHYLAADHAGLVRPTPRANVTVAVGELASRLGRTELAREYFERFLAEFQRDYRRTLVREKLAALPAPSAAPAR